MIDTTKLSSDWGYGNMYGYKPNTSTTATGTTGTSTASTGTTGDFQYPDAWANLQDIYSKMANGTYSNPAYSEGLDWTKMMAENGQPVDISGWADAYRPAMMDEYSNAVKQMAEQAGVGGTRYGSGLQQSIGNYGSQLQNQFNKDYMSNWLNAQESAKSRQMQAGSLYPTYANLGLNATTAGTEGLLGLGNAQGNYFNNAMQSLMNSGNYSNSTSIDPWTQMMAQMVGNPSYGQQTYNSSNFQNMLGVLGSMFGSDILGGSFFGNSSLT
jgi:hypothetical protein